MKTRLQKDSHKLAEVTFRRLLVDQHTGKKSYFPGQPDKETILKELLNRNVKTARDFSAILKQDIPLNPFLEIGAEKCQRSLYLVNELGLTGFAGDISFHSLASADYFRKMLHYKKMPLRISLDANRLPFRDNCLPFVFFYETLHHFPDPKPILDETYRVLHSDGYVFFAEEPVKQLFNLRLWRRDYNLTGFEKMLKFFLLLPFFSTIGKSEVAHGILEETFWLDTWEKSLSKYATAQAELKPFFLGKAVRLKKNRRGKWLKPNPLTSLLLAIQGGGIKALAQAQKRAVRNIRSSHPADLFACPTCVNRSPLVEMRLGFKCPKCAGVYRYKNNVLILLPKQIEKKLKF